jgi:hypothetical protein
MQFYTLCFFRQTWLWTSNCGYLILALFSQHIISLGLIQNFFSNFRFIHFQARQ